MQVCNVRCITRALVEKDLEQLSRRYNSDVDWAALKDICRRRRPYDAARPAVHETSQDTTCVPPRHIRMTKRKSSGTDRVAKVMAYHPPFHSRSSLPSAHLLKEEAQDDRVSQQARPT